MNRISYNEQISYKLVKDIKRYKILKEITKQ